MSAFFAAPAVVVTAVTGSGLEVNFFPSALTDVGNVEITGEAVKGEFPGVTETVGPDFGFAAYSINKGICRRNRICGAGRNVDAKEFPK